jgi:release factor glutamine methyltransferase
MTTIAAALAAARAKLSESEARLLLGRVMGRSGTWLISHDHLGLDEDALLNFAALVARRAAGEPVAYLIGRREFFGREFAVSPAVLIPRPDTELLVEIGLKSIAAGAAPRILDLGTGSGCVAITLALECPQAQVSAVDKSEAALAVAGWNATQLGANVRLIPSDWFAALAGEIFDLIVANPPYIAAGDPHLSAGDLRHEPSAALAGGADGLHAIRHIVAAASAHLTPDGYLWLEHGYDQALAVRELLAAAALVNIEQHRDIAGILRVSGARRR